MNTMIIYIPFQVVFRLDTSGSSLYISLGMRKVLKSPETNLYDKRADASLLEERESSFKFHSISSILRGMPC